VVFRENVAGWYSVGSLARASRDDWGMLRSISTTLPGSNSQAAWSAVGSPVEVEGRLGAPLVAAVCTQVALG
jgi:hypothetical protein